jgi:hypothetical protein
MEGPATSTTGGSASANSSTMGTTTSTGSVTSNIPSMSSDTIIQVRFVFIFCFFWGCRFWVVLEHLFCLLLLL